MVHGFGTRLGVEAPKSAGLQSTAALRQVHSDTIHVVNEQTASQLTGDGLITAVAGLALKIRTADCVPLLIAASDGRAVGAFHAGWRGTLARIAEKAVGAFRQRLDIAPEELVAAIGPCIHSCCYEVSAEMRDHFSSQFDYGNALFTEVFSSDPVREKYPLMFMNMRAPGHGEQPSKPHLDLVEANRRQLVSAGVPEGAIDISPLCTSCRTDLLFSYRAEKGTTGRLVTQIARTAPGAARLA
ncbi:MAG: peptidoglycan editing factor PgeF [Acidobacteria bacterium]|nr:peptidoglycan editing factor PgeF [Acidobacteriota bacterium]